MKRFLFVFILMTTACGAAPATANPVSFFDDTPVPAGLRLDSTSGQIQKAMWESAVQWKTLQMDGQITWFADGTAVQSFHESSWLDPLNSRYKVEWSGILNNNDRFLRFSDGSSIYHVDLNSGRVDSFGFPDSARVGQYIPPLVMGETFPNPLWAQIGTPLSQLAFPADYSQNDGIFTLVGAEQIAGRETVIVEWRYSENSMPVWKMWLDTQTALILKLQEFSKDGSGILEEERTVNSITLNATLEDALFALPSDLPAFVQATQGASGPVIAESAGPSTGGAGELYFFLQPRQTGQAIQLVKVPGVCISEPAICPPMGVVKVPFAFNFTIHALSWSSDGRHAAFAYSDQPKGTPTKLWLFDPAAAAWVSLAEFPYIDPPFWSPDGAWIAFRTQDGLGGEEVYVIHPDGTSLTQISSHLPAEGRPYIMDGWFLDSVMMRSALPGHESNIYLVRASDSSTRAMFTTAPMKSTFVAAPDASLLAYDDLDAAGQDHLLKTVQPDGTHPTALAEFKAGSIYPIVWSPDSQWIAFSYYGSLLAAEPKADVYVVRRDGMNLSLIYSGSTIGHLIFTPDGLYLLVEETTSTTGGHLFVVDLGSLEKRMLQAPLLSTDYDWYAPSWRP